MESYSHKTLIAMLWIWLTWATRSWVCAEVECSTVTALICTCSVYINYGSPDPVPGSPCCDAVSSLNLIANADENRRAVCICVMGLLTTYNPNATAIATLPGFCGVNMGFTIDPNTDCN